MGEMCCKGTTYFCYRQKSRRRVLLNGFNTRVFPSQQSLLIVLAREKLWVGEQISISFTGREDRFADGRIGFHQVDLSVTVSQLSRFNALLFFQKIIWNLVTWNDVSSFFYKQHALKGQKLLAQGSALGIMSISKAPCKGKSFVCYPVF